MRRPIAKTASIDWMRLSHLMMFAFLAIAIYLMITTQAHAGALGPGALCWGAMLVQSVYGRGLATIVIMALGIGAMVGKVSWPIAILTAVGIAVLFAASTIAGNLGAFDVANVAGHNNAPGCSDGNAAQGIWTVY